MAIEPVTLEHVLDAAKWAQTAVNEPQQIDGESRRYNQGQWDCGASCCLWGAAHLKAGLGPTKKGPSAEWSYQSLAHTLVAGLMKSGTATPEQMIAILERFDLARANLAEANLAEANLAEAHLEGANLAGADLEGADLAGANLEGANLAGANLARANLARANLARANLEGATITIGNVNRKIAAS